MKNTRWIQMILGLIVVVAVSSPGCSCGGDTDAGTTGPPGSSSSSSGGQGGAGGQGGGGTGGQGGGMAADRGAPGMDFVSAGDTAKSPNYTLIFTFGQSTQNQQQTTSPNYQLRGGLVGATGSK